MNADLPSTWGLHDLGDGCHVWLEPPGGWGYANSGIVTLGDEVLVVDTQNDMALAAALQDAVAEVTGGRAASIVVNTHADGDHWNGNLLFDQARIVSSAVTADEMAATWLDPTAMEEMAERAAGTAFGRFIAWRIRTFDFDDWRPVLPSETFSGRKTVNLGGGHVADLLEVGPAHTRGDVVVHVPSAGVVYAGDVLFTDSTPIIWAGPISRSIAALDRIVSLGPRVVVPGHGPVVRPEAVRVVREYLELVLDHASGAYDAGLTPEEAYARLEVGTFACWPHASRAYQNILAVYRERDPDAYSIAPPQALELVLADDDGHWTRSAKTT